MSVESVPLSQVAGSFISVANVGDTKSENNIKQIVPICFFTLQRLHVCVCVCVCVEFCGFQRVDKKLQ